MIAEFLPVILALVAAGLVAGFMAGLLGIGGGVVTIPALYTVFEILDYSPDWRMHMAVATSLTIIIATNTSSVRAHHKRGGVDWTIVKSWWIWLTLGALLGAGFAKQLKTDELIYFFASLIVLLAIKMLLPIDKIKLGDVLPKGILRYISPSLIGFFSSVMGIGGGSFSVPYLTLYSVPIHRAVGTAALAGFVISVAGGVGFIITGFGVEGLPAANIGFINVPAAIIVAIASVVMAPVGAMAAHKLSKRMLSIIFGFFLVMAAIRLLAAL